MRLLRFQHFEFRPMFLLVQQHRNYFRLQSLELEYEKSNLLKNDLRSGEFIKLNLLMNEIHIFSKFESSTNSRMNGFTTVIKSQIGVLHVTTPDGKANTFVPDGPVNDSVVDFALASRR